MEPEAGPRPGTPEGPRPASFDALARELEQAFDRTFARAVAPGGPNPAAGADAPRREGTPPPWAERDFNRLALAAFALQFASIPAYRGMCETRGLTPATVTRWEEVPPVPATAFKHLDLTVQPNRRPEAVFRTSGTSRGRRARGRHLVARLSLYRRSLVPTFGAHVVRGGRLPFISLVPPWRERADSSLSFMVSAAAESYATEALWLVDGRGRLDEDRLRSTLQAAERATVPVLLVGTALALLHAAEMLEAFRPVALPPGSRIMDTGGFKGMERETTRDELHTRLAAVTGVPLSMMVGEYGMTELLSQLYEPVLEAGVAASGWYVPAPWLRVRALDPTTLAEVPDGAPGLLAFFDLANAGSVCHVLTEDLGAVWGGRVRLEGRAAGAEPRGCSIAMDELMEAAKQSDDQSADRSHRPARGSRSADDAAS
ncbi:MAG: acyl-protein synthetase [Gemmatimonadales bacterium]